MKYYIICSWADSQVLSDNLNYKKIPFALFVISWTECRLEISAEHLATAQTIPGFCKGWKEARDHA